MKGIYAIRNKLNGKHYVGSTAISISGRFKSHRYQLRNGKHHSPSLQRSWDKHGESAFDFVVIEEFDDAESLLAREQYWIDKLRAADGATGYNVAAVAGTRAGVPQPEEMKERYRQERTGIPKSVEHRRKISESQKGKVISQVQREKLRAAALRQWSDPLAREAQSKRKTGKPSAFKGMSHTDETKAILSEKAKSRRETNISNLPEMTGEIREKLRRANLGKKMSEEARAKMSASRKGVSKGKGIPKSEEWKRQHSEALKGKSRPDARTPTAETILRMKELRSIGLSYAKIGVEVGKDASTVFKYVNK